MVSSADVTSSFCHTISQTSVSVSFHVGVRFQRRACSHEMREKSVSQFVSLFLAGGGAGQVPYGNAPLIPAGVEGKPLCGQT